MNENISVSELSDEDIPQLVRFYVELSRDVEKETRDIYFVNGEIDESPLDQNLRKSLADSGTTTLMAKAGSKAVGFISGSVIPCFYPFSPIKHVGYISGAYVIPEFRRRGIMRTLEENLIKVFMDNGIGCVELFMLSANKSARKTWETLGYSTFRESMRKIIRP